MTPAEKEVLLDAANERLRHIQKEVDLEAERARERLGQNVSAAKLEDKWTNEHVKVLQRARLDQLGKMRGSPYFSRCRATFNGETQDYYFGKFSLTEQGVYSWIAAISSIRFDAPGDTTYTLPSGKPRSGRLHEKDEYQIKDDHIAFFSTESEGSPKTLVYQERVSAKKGGFLLPEIVSQMEKAQDTIIRAHHKEPFVVSGPAGSGKTTLALHRIAYLMQAPASADVYQTGKIVVFVQDKRSKEYFSHLLPDLGITNVSITTFSDWACSILGLEDQPLRALCEADLLYEQEKIATLRSAIKDGTLPKSAKGGFRTLDAMYAQGAQGFSAPSAATWEKQKKSKALDPIDLTALLMIHQRSHKKLSVSRTILKYDDRDELVESTKKEVLKYTLMVVDEFQNYLPEQLALLDSTVDAEYRSIIYVGDMAQQVNPGAIRDWADIDQDVPTDRHVRLGKVYRNTRAILQYVRSLGFDVQVPETLKEGVPVSERDFPAIDTLIEGLKDSISKRTEGETIGIIGLDADVVSKIKADVAEGEFVYVITARESQGLEFDKVFLVGFDKESYFDSASEHPEQFRDEKQKIDRDLLYIAVTRAIAELEVLRISQND